MAYVTLELSYYPADLPGALRHTGGLILSLILFFTFLKTGWMYAVYVSFYNSFLALILVLIGLYVAGLIKGKSIHMPWWGHGILFALIIFSLAYTYQTGIPFYNEVMQTAGKARVVLIVSFLGQAANTAFHWRGLGPHLSKEQEALNDAHANSMVIVTILSVFAAFVILSGALNNLFKQ
jgi:hypothetical protein